MKGMVRWKQNTPDSVWGGQINDTISAKMSVKVNVSSSFLLLFIYIPLIVLLCIQMHAPYKWLN